MKNDFRNKIATIGIVVFGILAGCGTGKVNAEEPAVLANSDSVMAAGAELTQEMLMESDAESVQKMPVESDAESVQEMSVESGTESVQKKLVESEVVEASDEVPDTTVPAMISENPAQIGVEKIDETKETQETAQVISTMEVRLVNKHYAGDVLKAKDFYVKVTRTDGTVEVNPLGWDAYPLELVEGDNIITVIFEDCTSVINVNVGVRPAEEPKIDENVVTAPVSVNPKAFAVSGTSVLEETPDMGQEYLDKIIFLGDSRTYSYKAYGVLSGGKKTKQVWTPKSGTMTLSAQSYAMIVYPETGKDMPIRDAVALKKPEYMIIGLGTNGISYMDEEDFRNEYFSLINDIKEISPDTKIMINSMFPIANYYKRLDLINNEKIAKANQWLVKIAEETDVKYLNTAEVLVDEEGWLNIGYDNGGEATHLNRQGNDIVMRYIRTHGYQE